MCFAFGGFLFYASVVVPTGSRILGSTTQGFVTREVTNVLNLASLGCALLLGWELWASWKQRSPIVRRALLGLDLWMAVCSLALMGLHVRMDRGLLVEQMAVLDTEAFYGLHRIYLWLSTLGWLASLPTMALLFCNRSAAGFHEGQAG